MTPRPAGMAAALRAMPTDARVHTLETALRRQLQLHLHIPPAHRISADRQLCRQGVHPLLALQLARALKRELDVEISPRLLCEGTLTEVAAAVAAGVGDAVAGRRGDPVAAESDGGPVVDSADAVSAGLGGSAAARLGAAASMPGRALADRGSGSPVVDSADAVSAGPSDSSVARLGAAVASRHGRAPADRGSGSP